MDELLASHEDDDLYPLGLPEGRDAREVVRASRLMNRLWWDLATADYDKVRDGQRLARAALDTGSDVLDPLIEILARIASDS
jgi:hypothetical protein